MEESLEDPIRRIHSFGHGSYTKNNMKRGISRSWFTGEGSKGGVSMGNKLRGRSGSRARREPEVLSLDRRGKQWFDASCTQSIIPYLGNDANKPGVSAGVTKGKVGSKHGLFRQLYRELQNFEEDTRVMKKAISEFTDERAKLVSEVRQQFHVVKESLKSGADTLWSPSVVGPYKDTSKAIGLSKVLDQDPNLPLVTRDIKVNLDVSQDLAKVFQ